MFKDKSTKRRIVTPNHAKESSTLDARHSQIINQFSEKQETLTDLRQKHNDLVNTQTDLKAAIAQHRADGGSLDTRGYEKLWTQLLRVNDEVQNMDKTIRNIQSCREEIEYYEKTADILYEYYRLLETQGNSAIPELAQTPPSAPPVATVTPAAPTSKSIRKVTSAPIRNILAAFASPVPDTATTTIQDSAGTTAATATASSSAPVPEVADKSALVDDYLRATDPMYIRRVDLIEAQDLCACCQTPLVCLQQEGIMVCRECGYQELLLVEQNRPILRAPSAKEGSHFSYKRINHFKEWCAQIQGKESTDIPEDVFERILTEIRKEKITDTKRITYNKMREILKKLKMNKYFEHINYIINRINGVPTPHFPPELEEKLYTMFRQIQSPFLKHCPSIRKNFLSYSYILFKLMEILGQHQYLGLFQLLKSREKVFNHDILWKKITEELGWPFYSTV